MIAAVYVRVSTEEQAAEGLSLRVQEQRCCEVAQSAGATEVRVYRDDGHSGTTTRRPGLQELLADLADLDVVVIWKLDRLSRSLRDMLDLCQQLGEANVGLRSISEGHDFTTPQGRLFLSMIAAVSEYFVGCLRDNTRAALRLRTEQGRYHGAPPFGYRCVDTGDGKTIEPLPEEAAVVVDVLSRYARGASISALRHHLNEQGVPCKQGAAGWATTTVRNLLTNPVYVGRFRMNGEEIEGIHPPIVSEHLWASVQRRRRSRARVPAKARDRTLCPLLRCGACPDGNGQVARSMDSRTPGYYTYFCYTRRALPKSKRHRPIDLSGSAVEAVIWAYARDLVTSGDLLDAAQRRAARQGEGEEDATAARIAVLSEQIERNADAYQAGALPLDLLTQRNRPRVEERERLRAKVVSGATGGLDPADARALAELTPEGIDRIAREARPGRQRELLEKLFDRIVLTKVGGGGHRGGGGRLTFHHVGDRPPVTVAVPGYYRSDGSTPVDLTPIPPTPAKG